MKKDIKHLEFALYRLRTWLSYRADHSLTEQTRKQTNARVRLWIQEVRNARNAEKITL